MAGVKSLDRNQKTQTRFWWVAVCNLATWVLKTRVRIMIEAMLYPLFTIGVNRWAVLLLGGQGEVLSLQRHDKDNDDNDGGVTGAPRPNEMWVVPLMQFLVWKTLTDWFTAQIDLRTDRRKNLVFSSSTKKTFELNVAKGDKKRWTIFFRTAWESGRKRLNKTAFVDLTLLVSFPHRQKQPTSSHFPQTHASANVPELQPPVNSAGRLCWTEFCSSGCRPNWFIVYELWISNWFIVK